MTLDEQIELEVAIIRERGITEKLFIVPVGNVRCFIPCNTGLCYCKATIDGKYCLVTETGANRAWDYANNSIVYLNKRLEKMEQQ